MPNTHSGSVRKLVQLLIRVISSVENDWLLKTAYFQTSSFYQCFMVWGGWWLGCGVGGLSDHETVTGCPPLALLHGDLVDCLLALLPLADEYRIDASIPPTFSQATRTLRHASCTHCLGCTLGSSPKLFSIGHL